MKRYIQVYIFPEWYMPSTHTHTSSQHSIWSKEVLAKSNCGAQFFVVLFFINIKMKLYFCWENIEKIKKYDTEKKENVTMATLKTCHPHPLCTHSHFHFSNCNHLHCLRHDRNSHVHASLTYWVKEIIKHYLIYTLYLWIWFATAVTVYYIAVWLPSWLISMLHA